MVTSTKTSPRASSAKKPTRSATATSKPTGRAVTAKKPSRGTSTVSTTPKSSTHIRATTSSVKGTPPASVAPTVPEASGAASAPSPHTPLERELASRILARRRLLHFTQRINPRYLAGWVHQDICRRLEKFSDDVAAGLSPRLMLLMPPRHGKSELASRMFPAWHLGRNPDHEIIAASYNVSLAMTFSRKVKEVLADPAYQSVFDARLHPDFQSNEEWAIHHARGSYVAAGVGGGITGRGCNVLIIDDPLKNAEEADSADTREKLGDWYGSTAYTRLAPGGGVLVIETWWHDDDLAGRLQVAMAGDEEADQFIVVKYPAVAEADEWLDETTDLIERVAHNFEQPTPAERAKAQKIDTCRWRLLRGKGEALHPERYDIQKLNRIKKTIQPRFWSALYQQNPVPDDGVYFLKEHFRRGPVPHISRANVYMAWDFAISEKKQNDYTVGTVGLQDADDMLHVAEVVRFKSADSLFIVESILNLCSRWASHTLVLGFEDGQIYRAIESLLKKRMRERRMYPSIVVLKPITDKMARARPLQGRMQQGMVSFSILGEWYDACRAEMLRFPAGVHDDIVDSLAWLIQLVLGRMPPAKPKEQTLPSWKDGLSTHGAGSHMTA